MGWKQLSLKTTQSNLSTWSRLCGSFGGEGQVGVLALTHLTLVRAWAFSPGLLLRKGASEGERKSSAWHISYRRSPSVTQNFYERVTSIGPHCPCNSSCGAPLKPVNSEAVSFLAVRGPASSASLPSLLFSPSHFQPCKFLLDLSLTVCQSQGSKISINRPPLIHTACWKSLFAT